jgi:hypothetical protein
MFENLNEFGKRAEKNVIRTPDLFDCKEYNNKIYHFIIQNYEHLYVPKNLLDKLVEDK